MQGGKSMKNVNPFAAPCVALAGLVVAWCAAPEQASAQAKPTTVAELAVYQGPDRQQILEEGAKKEGTLTFYTSGTVPTMVIPTIKAFNEKYPDIKVEYFRTDGRSIVTRVYEEQRSGNLNVDVIGHNGPFFFEGRDIVQPFYSPEVAALEEEAVKTAPGDKLPYWAGHWETCMVTMYNVNKIAKADAPKTYEDLLDPRFKGQMTLPTTTTGSYFIGNVLTHQGPEYIAKLAKQDVRVQKISGGALGSLVVAGEVPITPATYTSTAAQSLAKKAPIGVAFLNPVGCSLAGVMLNKTAAHPHAALLFMDFTLSKAAAEARDPQYASPRTDMQGRGLAAGPFKKFYYQLVDDPIKSHKAWNKILVEKFVEGR
jgi:iron(III) transport system substrate-binding protein